MHSLSQTCNMHVCSMVILLTYSTRLNVPNVSPTGPTLVLTHVRTLGAGSETNCSNSNTPHSTHRRTIYNIFSIAISGILQTTNAKAIYTFKFAIFKNTSISNAVQKSTTTISAPILSNNAVYKFDSITVLTIIWGPAVAPV